MTDHSSPPKAPPDEPAATAGLPHDRVMSADERAEPAGPSESAVHVFEGAALPQSGPAEPLSVLEDERAEAAIAPVEPALPLPDRDSPQPQAGPSRTAWVASSLFCGLVGAGLVLAAQSYLPGSSNRLEPRLAQLEQNAAATGDLRASAARLTAVEANLKTLESGVAGLRTLADSAAKKADEAASRPVSASDPQQASALSEQAARLSTLERLIAERTEAAGLAQREGARLSAEQEQRFAGLTRQAAEDKARLEAGLRVIAADDLGAALREGRALAASLPILERLRVEAPALAALQPYATTPPPSAAALAGDFKPVAERLRALQTRPAQAGEGWGARLMGLADEIVTIRPIGSAGETDPQSALGRIEQALARGDLTAAAAAWDALPEPARAESRAWGDALKRRVAAEAAARQIGAQALSALSAGTR